MEMDYSSLPYVVTNIVAVFIVVSAMTWPTAARLLLVVIFVGASLLNAYTAFSNPSVYLEFGKMTMSGLYRSIIFGPFSLHVPMYVIMIALCQLFIGIFIGYNGKLMKIAMIGGIVFFLAISPLGFGSAFPAPLMMAGGIIILMSKKIKFNIYDILYRKMNYLNP